MGVSGSVGGEGQDTSGIQIGDIRVIPFTSSKWRLDGGSLFGMVPRTLWEQKAPPDSLNRIAMNSNSLLVETGDVRLLVEPGIGVDHDHVQRDIYALADISAAGELARMGVSVEEVDFVVVTHLHFDHVGGAIAKGGSGEAVPAFPNARMVVQRVELQEAERGHPLVSPSYRRQDYEAYSRQDKVVLVQGDEEIAPGVRVELTGGHSLGHQVIRMISGGKEGLFLGDIVPSAAHLKLNWLAWDIEPRVVYEQKARLLDDCARRDVLLFFPHDPLIAACRVNQAGPGSYAVVEESVVKAGGDAG